MDVLAHTSEPWLVDPSGDIRGGINIELVGGIGLEKIASLSRMDPENGHHIGNANRIVTCVNACAGIPHSMLHPEAFIDLGTKLTEVATQRDQLLKAAIQLNQEMQAAWKSGALPAVAISGEAVRNFHAAITAAEVK